MEAISSRGAIFFETLVIGVCDVSRASNVEDTLLVPSNSVRSSMLKTRIIPKSGDKSMTYVLVPNFFVTLKRPVLRA